MKKWMRQNDFRFLVTKCNNMNNYYLYYVQGHTMIGYTLIFQHTASINTRKLHIE